MASALFDGNVRNKSEYEDREARRKKEREKEIKKRGGRGEGRHVEGAKSRKYGKHWHMACLVPVVKSVQAAK